jgi:hypothetical protein
MGTHTSTDGTVQAAAARPPRGRLGSARVTTAVLGVTTAAVFVAGVSSVATASAHRRTARVVDAAANMTSYEPALTPAQRSALRAMTDTPQKREKLARVMIDSFTRAGITVATSAPAAASAPSRNGGTYAAAAVHALPAYSAGVSWDHIWVIMSYRDIAYGAINVAYAFCVTKLPSWICSSVASVLRWYASGWGYGGDHGLWGAIYWWSYLHYTVGRW